MLVDGVHHVTFLTEDMDRLLTFYERVFDEGFAPPPAPGTMFARGRLDHFALLAPSEDAFWELRRRIEAEGAADGDVRSMRSLWIMGYFDPDGAAHEVILQRPGFADSDLLERAHWTTVTP